MTDKFFEKFKEAQATIKTKNIETLVEWIMRGAEKRAKEHAKRIKSLTTRGDNE